MLFAASKQSMLAALERVLRVVKSNPRSVDILQCVKLEAVGEHVYMTATSSMATVRVLIDPTVVRTPGSAVVNADRLKDRVSKSADSMTFLAVEGQLKIVSSDDQKLGLALNDPSEFPDVQMVTPDEEYGLDKKELSDLLKHAQAVTGQTSSLTPAFMQAFLYEQQMWVANGMSYQRFPVECNPHLHASIPSSALSPLAGFVKEAKGEVVWLSQTENGRDFIVTVGQDQFQTSPLAVEFPDLSPVFDRVRVASHHGCEVDRSRLASELIKAKTSVDTYGRVQFTIEGTGTAVITLKASTPSGDWYEGRVPCIWTGDSPREMVFNLESLLKFVQSFEDATLTLNIGSDFKGDLAPIYCEEEDHAGIINQFRI